MKGAYFTASMPLEVDSISTKGIKKSCHAFRYLWARSLLSRRPFCPAQTKGAHQVDDESQPEYLLGWQHWFLVATSVKNWSTIIISGAAPSLQPYLLLWHSISLVIESTLSETLMIDTIRQEIRRFTYKGAAHSRLVSLRLLKRRIWSQVIIRNTFTLLYQFALHHFDQQGTFSLCVHHSK